MTRTAGESSLASTARVEPGGTSTRSLPISRLQRSIRRCGASTSATAAAFGLSVDTSRVRHRLAAEELINGMSGGDARRTRRRRHLAARGSTHRIPTGHASARASRRSSTSSTWRRRRRCSARNKIDTGSTTAPGPRCRAGRDSRERHRERRHRPTCARRSWRKAWDTAMQRELCPPLPLRSVALCDRCVDGLRAGAPDRTRELYGQLHPLSVVLITMLIPADDPKRKGKWDEAYGSGAIVEPAARGARASSTDAHVVADARSSAGENR